MRNNKIWCICSGGGHLTELIEVVENIENYEKIVVTYRSKNNLVEKDFNRQYTICHPNLNLLEFIIDLLKIITIFFKERPKFLISTGGELAIVFFYLSKIFLKTKLIYIECSAQVYIPSITGRFIYPIADLFLVQWETLLKKYGKKAKYVGGLI